MNRGTWAYVVAFFLLPAILLALTLTVWNANLALVILSLFWFGAGVVFSPAVIES